MSEQPGRVPELGSHGPLTRRMTYSFEPWMLDALERVADANKHLGVRQADVARQCIEYGLAALYGIERPTREPRRP